jgi:hypothetical protein
MARHDSKGGHEMEPDIVIIRDGAGYRLLHGHLRLANLLRLAPAARIEVRGEGEIDVVKTPLGYRIAGTGRQAPLRCD